MRLLLTISLSTFFFAQAALASLGGSASTVESDRSALNGKTQITNQSLYAVHEITAGPRKVREFVRKDGTVFAVSWQGPVPPDLTLVLGQYYYEYQLARAPGPRNLRRGSRITRTEHAVIEEGGHMRAVHGKAYVPDLVPTGLNIARVR